MTNKDRQEVATSILDNLITNVKLTCDDGLFTVFQTRILQTIDVIDSPEYKFTKSVYNLVDGCSRDEISNLISLSTPEVVGACLRDMHSHIDEL